MNANRTVKNLLANQKALKGLLRLVVAFFVIYWCGAIRARCEKAVIFRFCCSSDRF
jgi:hypothetical protein